MSLLISLNVAQSPTAYLISNCLLALLTFLCPIGDTRIILISATKAQAEVFSPQFP